MSESKACLYEQPYEYVRLMVKPARDNGAKSERRRARWWLHARPAPEMRAAIRGLDRYIATSNVAKHRLFVWLESTILPSHSLTVFARDDHYFFGMLHSRPHEVWALRQGTSLEDRPRYTPTTCFETFPFPWPPGQEPADDPRVQAISQAAQELVQLRDAWLNPPDASDRGDRQVAPEERARSPTSTTRGPRGSTTRIASSTPRSSPPMAGPRRYPTRKSWSGCWRSIWRAPAANGTNQPSTGSWMLGPRIILCRGKRTHGHSCNP